MVEGHGALALASQAILVELSVGFSRLAAGPQRFYPSGSGFSGYRRQQESGSRSCLPAARRELPAIGNGSLPEKPSLRECGCCRQASGPQWLTMEAAVRHCTEGIGLWEWA